MEIAACAGSPVACGSRVMRGGWLLFWIERRKLVPDIIEYSARWYVVKNKGVIKVKDRDGNTTELEFADPAEFTAVLTILNCHGDAWLGDFKGERIVSSGEVLDEPATHRLAAGGAGS